MKRLYVDDGTNEKAIEFAAGKDNKPRPVYDNLLIPYAIKECGAYSEELYRQKRISVEEYNATKDGLVKLTKKLEEGNLSVEGYEDVHSLIEFELRSMYEDLVGNVALGKSRNESICTLMRMWMRDSSEKINNDIEDFISVLESEIEVKGELVIPGYSHYRIAMPTTYGELLKSYKTGLKRDKEKLEFWLEQYNECPLGVGAGFSSLELDRDRIAKELGFDRPTESSIDTVTTRWEAEASLGSSLSVLLNHLSTIAQDFIYLSSEGIDVISLPEEYCTGSSLILQKKNPDVLEVIKGKASTSVGRVSSILMLGQGNISGYNRNTQLTKYEIMDLVEGFDGLFEVLGGLVKGIKVNEEQSKKLLKSANAYSTQELIDNSTPEDDFRNKKLKAEKELKGISKGDD